MHFLGAEGYYIVGAKGYIYVPVEMNKTKKYVAFARSDRKSVSTKAMLPGYDQVIKAVINGRVKNWTINLLNDEAGYMKGMGLEED